ncbi:hypothetical protein V6R21_20105 [Limibacter armeniacum]|uniref:hypothetical protein n=1 Tax=Limibacter armeniacum TaxID=466084 RepID=UPI002FE61BA7
MSGQLEVYRNHLEEEIKKGESLQLEKAAAESLLETSKMEWLRKFSSLEKQYNSLQSAYRVMAEVKATEQAMVIHDTTYIPRNHVVPFQVDGKFVIWESQYAWGQLFVPDTGRVTEVTYSVHVPLDLVLYRERKWWKFWKTKYYAEARSANKNVEVTGLNSITITKRK